MLEFTPFNVVMKNISYEKNHIISNQVTESIVKHLSSLFIFYLMKKGTSSTQLHLKTMNNCINSLWFLERLLF